MRVQSDMSRGCGLPLRLGVSTERVTPELVDEVIEVTGAREARRRVLPARAVLYFVLGLAPVSAADSVGPPRYRSLGRTLHTSRVEFLAYFDTAASPTDPPRRSTC